MDEHNQEGGLLTPYEEGKEARKLGKKLKDNPYVPDWQKWEEGYRSSESESEIGWFATFILICIVAIQIGVLVYLFL